MKSALITNFPPYTGAGRYAFNLFTHLKDMTDVDLLFCNGDESSAEVKRIDGHNFPLFKKTLNAYFCYPKKIPQNYDIYHISNQFLSRTLKFRTPSILTILDLIPLTRKELPFLVRYLQKKALKYAVNARRIISISEYTKNDIIRLLNIPADKIEVIYIGVDSCLFKKQNNTEARKRLKLPTDKKIILHVGSEEPRKNVASLVKAFYKLQKKKQDILLIRVGEKRKQIENLIDTLGIRDKVIRYTNLREDKLSLVYNAADLFIFPSFYEGFGFPPLEAMACGVPVITSNRTSLPEIVGDAGIMIDPDDTETLADKMYEVLRNEVLRNDMIKKGLKRSKMFSWEICAKKTLKVYNEVVGE
jgi:glycosyltransferase involved in cell wall biosynthesis